MANHSPDDPQALACDAYSSCFKENLKLLTTDIDRHVEAATKSLKESLRYVLHCSHHIKHTLIFHSKIHLNAVRVRYQDYFPQAMADIYVEAHKKKAAGKGASFYTIRIVPLTKSPSGVTMKDSRCRYLKEAIPGPMGPFSKISGRAQDDAEKAIKEASGTLKGSLDKMLGRVQNAFDRMKTKKENDTEQGKRFRAELHELVAEARRILGGVAKESLELCKQHK
jgi:hypothetical protein